MGRGRVHLQRGFTLIELLVVIAIIGVLSAVVLVSLNTARSKGNDAGVKANLATVGTQAALYLSDHEGSYGTFALADCPASGAVGATVFHDPTIERAIATALADAGSEGTAKCAASSEAYAVAVKRPDTTHSTYWCIDSVGERCGINSIVPPATACGLCGSRQ